MVSPNGTVARSNNKFDTAAARSRTLSATPIKELIETAPTICPNELINPILPLVTPNLTWKACSTSPALSFRAKYLKS